MSNIIGKLCQGLVVLSFAWDLLRHSILSVTWKALGRAWVPLGTSWEGLRTLGPISRSLGEVLGPLDAVSWEHTMQFHKTKP